MVACISVPCCGKPRRGTYQMLKRKWLLICTLYSIAVYTLISYLYWHTKSELFSINSLRALHTREPYNYSHELTLLMNILPQHTVRRKSRDMFCAAKWDKQVSQYLAVASNRPSGTDMTGYRMSSDGTVLKLSSQYLPDFGDWQDPRLLQLSDGVLLVCVQTMGRPFGVARLYTNSSNDINSKLTYTLGPISKLGIQKSDGKVVYQGTKNWMPFSDDGVLHFVISAFPLVVVRCESPDNIKWDVCQPQPSEGALPHDSRDIQRWQRNMILRGGSDLVPYPTQRSGIWIGFLHTRLNCKELKGYQRSVLHVPILIVVTRVGTTGRWRTAYISDVPSITIGPNWISSLPSPTENERLLLHQIQDPVSVARVDKDSGDVFVTLNIRDSFGVCALGVYKGLLNKWVLNTVHSSDVENYMETAYNRTIMSIEQLCRKRYSDTPKPWELLQGKHLH